MQPDLALWLHRHSDELFLSVITVAEIQSGIAKAKRTGSHRKADLFNQWLDGLLHLYAARVIPLDIETARGLGTLSDLARSTGGDPGFADLAIAATALSCGYTVLTRNLRHFQALPVACHDPFATLPTPG